MAICSKKVEVIKMNGLNGWPFKLIDGLNGGPDLGQVCQANHLVSNDNIHCERIDTEQPAPRKKTTLLSSLSCIKVLNLRINFSAFISFSLFSSSSLF